MLPENNISFARKQSLNNKHTLYKNSNINLFTSFTLGNKIIARGYDNLSSNYRKEKIITDLEKSTNTYTSKIQELEEIVITVKIPKTTEKSTKKLYVLDSLQQDIFKFLTRFRSVIKSQKWTDSTAIAYFEHC